MNLVCSPSWLVDINRPQKGVADIVSAGFEGIVFDITMCCSPYELEYLGIKQPFLPKERKQKETKNAEDDTKKKQQLMVSEHPEEMHNYLNCLAKQCKKEHLLTPIARAPYLYRNTKRKDGKKIKEVLERLAKESIRLCGSIGCSFLLVDPLSAGVARGEEWAVNREYYLALAKEAISNHVTILLQNQCLDLNGHLVRGNCADADEACLWIDQLNNAAGVECFGFCLDAGISNLCGQDMREFIVTLGSRIKAVILRDCDGHYDTAMLPFTCANRGQSPTDWLGLIRGLREIGFDGQLIMEFGTTTGAFISFLRPQLLLLAGEVANYFRWQISMKRVLEKYRQRVLFGAGNMCRNYMKCYGDEFPPLFTCDNNRARWGERFEGLEIKPPEVLKRLPDDCAVFICNIYYKEIEQQLREMGVMNPIEYFNDEYMPSYYFDRLEYWEEPQQ